MPTLNWIGKQAVVHHAREVPYRLLRPEAGLSAGEAASGNLLVEGDNLLALKALLPYYAGRVKCIYIDPPYNTGNEGWVYNDAVNGPEMRAWLGQVVGREAEDLSRHDKWLCMMYPRLVLLRQMLRPDGAIFISIARGLGLPVRLRAVHGVEPDLPHRGRAGLGTGAAAAGRAREATRRVEPRLRLRRLGAVPGHGHAPRRWVG